MNETLEYLEKGLITPIAIAKEFDASSVAEAFKHLLPGTHIGRVGVHIRDVEGRPTFRGEVVNPPKKLQLDPEGSTSWPVALEVSVAPSLPTWSNMVPVTSSTSVV